MTHDDRAATAGPSARPGLPSPLYAIVDADVAASAGWDVVEDSVSSDRHLYTRLFVGGGQTLEIGDAGGRCELGALR